MEWVRQRFRLGLDSSGCNSNNRKLYKLSNHSLGMIIACTILFVNVICLPNVVLSAADKSGGSINSVNFISDQNLIKPQASQIWRNIRQVGGLKGTDDKNVNNSSLNISGDETESTSTTGRTKRPVLHRKPHPDAIITSSKDSFNNKNDTLDKADKEDNRLHDGYGHDDKDGSLGDEMHKIQSILRDIFLDELDSDEDDVEEEEIEETEYTSITHDDVSRSSQNDLKNKTRTLLSRFGRSAPDNQQGRAGPKGKSKAARARPSSSNKGNNNNSSNGGGRQKNKSSKGSSKGSDLAKYNDYMDSVFRRMNTMIKSKKMDPLRVNLYAGASKGPSKTGAGASGGKGKKKYSPRMNLESLQDKGEEEWLEDEDDSEDGPARRDIFLNISHHEDTDHESTRKIRALLENVNSTNPDTSDSPRGTNSDSKPKKLKQSSNKGGNKSSNKGQGTNGGGNKKSGNNKATTEGAKNKGSKNKKNNRNQNTRPTRGILHGLSTLKREGNVAVIKQGEQARIVRANFLLGPVSLEIMPKKGKATDDGKPVAATATASKLKGVLEVRLKKGSPTRIRRLRVYPPKNVKVEGTSQSGTKGTKGNKKPQQYGKVTPMATARLRQIASTVVRQADKSSNKKSP